MGNDMTDGSTQAETEQQRQYWLGVLPSDHFADFMVKKEQPVLDRKQEKLVQETLRALPKTKEIHAILSKAGLTLTEKETGQLKQLLLAEKLINSYLRSLVIDKIKKSEEGFRFGVIRSEQLKRKRTQDYIGLINKTIQKPDIKPIDMIKLLSKVGIFINLIDASKVLDEHKSLRALLKENPLEQPFLSGTDKTRAQVIQEVLLSSRARIAITQEVISKSVSVDQILQKYDELKLSKGQLEESIRLIRKFQKDLSALRGLKDINAGVLVRFEQNLSEQLKSLEQNLNEVNTLYVQVDILKKAHEFLNAMQPVEMMPEAVAREVAGMLVEVDSKEDATSVVTSCQEMEEKISALEKQKEIVDQQIRNLLQHQERMEQFGLSGILPLSALLREKEALLERFDLTVDGLRKGVIESARKKNAQLLSKLSPDSPDREADIMTHSQWSSLDIEGAIWLKSLPPSLEKGQGLIVRCQNWKEEIKARKEQVDFWMRYTKDDEDRARWEKLQKTFREQMEAVEARLGKLNEKFIDIVGGIPSGKDFEQVYQKIDSLMKQIEPFLEKYADTLDISVFDQAWEERIERASELKEQLLSLWEKLSALEQIEGPQEVLRQKTEEYLNTLNRLSYERYPDTRPKSGNPYENFLRQAQAEVKENLSCRESLERIISSPEGVQYLLSDPRTLDQFRKLNSKMLESGDDALSADDDPAKQILLTADPEELLRIAENNPLYWNVILSVAEMQNFLKDPEVKSRIKAVEAQSIDITAASLVAKVQRLVLELDIREVDGELGSLLFGSDSERKQSMRAVTDYVNQLSNFVVLQILNQSSLEARVAVFERWIRIANACKEKGDLHSAMAICSAFSRTGVNRLSQTKNLLSVEALIQRDQLNTLLSQEGSFKNLRAYTEQNPDTVPFLGFYLTDLTFIDEGNRGSPIMQRALKEEKVIRPLWKLKNIMEPVIPKLADNVYSSIKTSPTLTDQELSQLSLQCEPRSDLQTQHRLFSEWIDKLCLLENPGLEAVVLDEVMNSKETFLSEEQATAAVIANAEIIVKEINERIRRGVWRAVSAQELRGLFNKLFNQVGLGNIDEEKASMWEQTMLFNMIANSKLRELIRDVLPTGTLLKASGNTQAMIAQLNGLVRQTNQSVQEVFRFLVEHFGITIPREKGNEIAEVLKEESDKRVIERGLEEAKAAAEAEEAISEATMLLLSTSEGKLYFAKHPDELLERIGPKQFGRILSISPEEASLEQLLVQIIYLAKQIDEVTLSQAKEALEGGREVIQAIYNAGYGEDLDVFKPENRELIDADLIDIYAGRVVTGTTRDYHEKLMGLLEDEKFSAHSHKNLALIQGQFAGDLSQEPYKLLNSLAKVSTADDWQGAIDITDNAIMRVETTVSEYPEVFQGVSEFLSQLKGAQAQLRTRFEEMQKLVAESQFEFELEEPEPKGRKWYQRIWDGMKGIATRINNFVFGVPIKSSTAEIESELGIPSGKMIKEGEYEEPEPEIVPVPKEGRPVEVIRAVSKDEIRVQTEPVGIDELLSGVETFLEQDAKGEQLFSKETYEVWKNESGEKVGFAVNTNEEVPKTVSYDSDGNQYVIELNFDLPGGVFYRFAKMVIGAGVHEEINIGFVPKQFQPQLRQEIETMAEKEHRTIKVIDRPRERPYSGFVPSMD
jgi:hypothetical protein